MVALVGWLLLTLVAAAVTGYTVWRATGSAFLFEGPDAVLPTETGQVEATATVIPTPRVIRLTPDFAFATTPRPTATPALPSKPEPTKRSVVASPSAPSEPTPAAPELVTNGSFESGTVAWYLENGAAPVAGTTVVDGTMVLQIPSGGGYADQRVSAVPGETYLLIGSGRVTAEGDTGRLGVVYRDAAGVRLTALEPPPIAFTRTRFRAKRLVFTVPAGVAEVLIYAYKEAGPGQFETDAVSVRQVDEP
jgi:hypothetical protein